MSDQSRARARDRVLFALKRRGPATAAQLAERLEVTSMAVRQHLAALEAEGLVEGSGERRAVGRPARVWSLSAAAQARFPDAHADLTVELLGALRKTFGEKGLDALVAERGREQERAYRATIRSGRGGKGKAGLEARLDALVARRSDEGYMASWRRDSDGSYLLAEDHCPICAAAAVCQGLCRQELALFRSVLGKGVEIERSEHILDGARRCAYRITPV